MAIGKQSRAIAVTDMDRPNALHGIAPTLLLDVKPHRLQLGLEGVDGGFERRVFAENKTVSGQSKSLFKNSWGALKQGS